MIHAHFYFALASFRLLLVAVDEPTRQADHRTNCTGPVNAVTFSSSPGTYLLTGSSDRSVHLSRALPSSTKSPGVAPTTTAPIQKYDAHGYSVLDLAVAADNARFVSVGGDKQVFLWDVETGTTIRRWSGHTGRVEAVEFGGETDSVVVSGGCSPLGRNRHYEGS